MMSERERLLWAWRGAQTAANRAHQRAQHALAAYERHAGECPQKEDWPDEEINHFPLLPALTSKR